MNISSHKASHGHWKQHRSFTGPLLRAHRASGLCAKRLWYQRTWHWQEKPIISWLCSYLWLPSRSQGWPSSAVDLTLLYLLRRVELSPCGRNSRCVHISSLLLLYFCFSVLISFCAYAFAFSTVNVEWWPVFPVNAVDWVCRGRTQTPGLLTGGL